MSGYEQTEARDGRSWPRAVRWLTLVLGGMLGLSASAGPLIADVTTDAARYSPGELVRIVVTLRPTPAVTGPHTVAAAIYHLGHLVDELPAERLAGAAGAAAPTATLTWTAPQPDYTGYQVVVAVKAGDGAVLDQATTAVDVSSDWAKFPRYGYLSHFEPGIDAEQVVAALNAYHLNGLQFYDWQWKHHVPYVAADEWRDIANRPISRATVARLIAAAHARRMMAMNYNLYGGAVDGYTQDGSGAALAMGIFSKPRPPGGYTLADQEQYAMPPGWATHILYQMNNRDPAWIRYICGREQDVFAHFAFDGWHIDSLGTGTVYDYNGAQFDLRDAYPEFLNAVRARLGRPVVFNCVDAGGEEPVAQRADVAFVYSELWDHDPNYADIARRVASVRAVSDKALVLAAYPDRAVKSGEFGEAGVRLLDAAIFASGAAHIELGDAAQMLHTEYFPDDQVKMSDRLRRAMRANYDFLVAYENLLRDATTDDPAKTTLAGIPGSTDAAPGAVWLIRKQSHGCRVLHLVNLLHAPSAAWRDNHGDYPAPPVLSDVKVTLHYAGAPAGQVWIASPDQNGGVATAVAFARGEDHDGGYLTFVVPRLEYWTTVWVEPAAGAGAAPAARTPGRAVPAVRAWVPATARR